MKKKTFYFYLAFSTLTVPGIGIAEINVIADLGGESAVRFYEPIQPVHDEDAPVHPNAVPSQVTEAQLLPVISHKWSVGKVNSIPMNLPGALPMFLIGSDDVSHQWLTQQAPKLTDLNAMGLVINVNSVEEMDALRQRVPALTLLPAPADTLADRLGIYHYPLLITSEGVSQ